MKLSMIAAIAATATMVALSTSGAYALSCKGGCPPGPFNPGKPGAGAAGASTATCSVQLSYMRRVLPQQIEALGEDDRITITPFCEDEDPGMLRADGNAGALRAPIGRNPVLVAELAEEDYTNEDVVAVRMTPHGAILYVAPQNY